MKERLRHEGRQSYTARPDYYFEILERRDFVLLLEQLSKVYRVYDL